MSNQPRQEFTGSCVAQYVNQPRPGKKMGSIKDTTGVYWNVNPADLARVNPNDTVTFTYNPSDRGGGFVTGILTVNGQPSVAPPVGTQAQAPVSLPPQYAPPPNQDPRPEPPPVAAPPFVAPATPAHDTPEHIYVTGVVGRSMQSGQFAVTDIDLLTKAAVDAYRNWMNS